VSAYRAEDWALGHRDLEYIVAQVKTNINGQWKRGMMLDPGDYVLLYSKSGSVQPATVSLTVT